MDQYRTAQPKQVAPKQSNETPMPMKVKKRELKNVAIAVVLVLLLLVAAGAGYKLIDKKAGSGLVGVNPDDYQALFLTNGQVYFGKLKSADSKTIELKDIYYLQVQQAVQPKPEPKNSDAEAEQQGETSLVKLGSELHGPQDQMYIDRGQVLFWENLKEDGKVVAAIREYQKK